jgi:hypothetical protein
MMKKLLVLKPPPSSSMSIAPMAPKDLSKHLNESTEEFHKHLLGMSAEQVDDLSKED